MSVASECGSSAVTTGDAYVTRPAPAESTGYEATLPVEALVSSATMTTFYPDNHRKELHRGTEYRVRKAMSFPKPGCRVKSYQATPWGPAMPLPIAYSCRVYDAVRNTKYLESLSFTSPLKIHVVIPISCFFVHVLLPE